jgi:hypothetical protein
MADTIENDGKPDEQTQKQVRRPWHPPQFIMTDIASTDVQGNAGRDGGTAGSLS